MKDLIKRELYINKDLTGLALVLPIVLILLLRESTNSQDLYALFTHYSVFMIGISIIEAMRHHNNETEILFLSLPIERDDFLKIKYLVYGTLTLLLNMVMYFAISISSLFPRFQHIELRFDMAIFSMAITLIILAILIPILYKVKERYILFHIIIVIFVFVLRDVIRGIIIYKQGDINFGLVSTILLVISIISYILSFKMSKNSLNGRWLGNERTN